MRGMVWLGVIFIALPAGARAQSTPLDPVSLTPPAAEPGFTVRPLNGGYARWETDTEGGEQGGVQVVPAPRTEATEPSEVRAEGEKALPGRAPPARPPPSVCEEQRQRLAVRLLELRGIDATTESAPYVLAAIEAPLWPQAYAGVRGLGPGAGSSLLATAYSSDLIARDLVDDLTRCLTQAKVPARVPSR